jgi:hypothetical protein
MTPLNLSESDYSRIIGLSYDRFRAIYPLPPRTNLLMTLDGKLLIGVEQSAGVAALLDDAEWLKRVSQIVFGTIWLSIWLGESEVWSSPTLTAQSLPTNRRRSLPQRRAICR